MIVVLIGKSMKGVSVTIPSDRSERVDVPENL